MYENFDLALKFKNEGSNLFRQNLYPEALSKYREGLSVLFRPKFVDYLEKQTVSTNDEFDHVCLEGKVEDVERMREEESVEGSNLRAMIFNNMARCYLNLKKHAEVIRYASIVLHHKGFETNKKALLRLMIAREESKKELRALKKEMFSHSISFVSPDVKNVVVEYLMRNAMHHNNKVLYASLNQDGPLPRLPLPPDFAFSSLLRHVYIPHRHHAKGSVGCGLLLPLCSHVT